MSLRYIENKKGDNDSPCLTPKKHVNDS